MNRRRQRKEAKKAYLFPRFSASFSLTKEGKKRPKKKKRRVNTQKKAS
jgi:hypothetical protein